MSERETPPDLPDPSTSHMAIDNPSKISFRDIVTNTLQSNPQPQITPITIDNEESSVSGVIQLSEADKKCLYNPWKHSVIVKLVGKKLNHRYLQTKLSELWKLQEGIALIDLGLAFFIVKFKWEESQRRVLQNRPWFVAGSYLSVPLEMPLHAAITIGSHRQPIIFEGEGFLCKTCGRLDHGAVG
ncbi:hypothetical protein BC332_27953 [Capsicum chinense]|nr:hypothetical protein BC332_27953 [Capsicum chinense]